MEKQKDSLRDELYTHICEISMLYFGLSYSDEDAILNISSEDLTVLKNDPRLKYEARLIRDKDIIRTPFGDLLVVDTLSNKYKPIITPSK